MITIKVWGLPNAIEDKLNRLHKAIVEAVVSISELGFKNEKDMVCLFPADLMKYGLGEEIIIEIDGVPDMPGKNLTVYEQLAQYVGKTVLALYPDAMVECFVEEFRPSARWTNNHQ